MQVNIHVHPIMLVTEWDISSSPIQKVPQKAFDIVLQSLDYGTQISESSNVVNFERWRDNISSSHDLVFNCLDRLIRWPKKSSMDTKLLVRSFAHVTQTVEALICLGQGGFTRSNILLAQWKGQIFFFFFFFFFFGWPAVFHGTFCWSSTPRHAHPSIPSRFHTADCFQSALF